MIIERVSNFIKENRLLKPGDMVVAGISGGPDSMVMLYLLKELRNSLGFSLQAAHINHNLRDNALAEQKLVEKTCQQYQVELHIKSIDVASIAREEKKSIELMGREQRYCFFENLRKQFQGPGEGIIATAHHIDDQVETVLLHLVRGSGIKGLSGVRPRREYLIRPLLGLTKTEILSFARQNEIAYAEDDSNMDLYYTRNRIRHGLLPVLQKEYNKQITGALNRMALLLSDEDEWLEQVTAQYWAEICSEQGPGYAYLQIAPLKALPPAGQRRILLRAISHVQQNKQNWEMHDIERIRGLLEKEGSAKKVTGKEHLSAYKLYDKILISLNITDYSPFCYQVSVPGMLVCSEIKARFHFIAIKNGEPNLLPYNWKTDYRPFKGKEIFIRSWEPGDTIAIDSLSGRKKIKKIFNEKRIPHMLRGTIPIITNGIEVLGALGVALSSKLQVTKQTEEILYIMREDG